jgi:hypothetical protein
MEKNEKCHKNFVQTLAGFGKFFGEISPRSGHAAKQHRDKQASL